MSRTLLIVGGGKMGSALLGGLLASGWISATHVAVAETSADRRLELAVEFPGVEILDAPVRDLLEDSPTRLAGAVLAVKPDVAEGACRVLGAVGVTRVLSIVAGIPSARLETALGGQPSVVRAMPNTAGRGRSRRHCAFGGLARHLGRSGVGRRDHGGGGHGGSATRAPARSRDRPFGIRPRLFLPRGRGADRGRGPDGPHRVT